jgi:hypothetical protein
MNQLQQSIARIHEACQAPPLSPPEYRALFETMTQEIGEQGLQGAQTLASIQGRLKERGLQLNRDDIRFVLDVVGEPDPWFEQGASAPLFAGRFRNFVVARCRSQGLNLSVDELDLVEAWFAGGPPPVPAATPVRGGLGDATPSRGIAADGRSDNWWSSDTSRALPPPAAAPMRTAAQEPAPLAMQGGDQDEFPRIVRTRVRG